MSAIRRRWAAGTLPESSIVLIGLLCTVLGLTFRDSIGITPLLTAVGIGLVIAGTVYIAVEGPELVRLALVFVSLVAVQLVTFGGVVQRVGGVAIGAVAVAILYTRVST